MLTFLIKAKDVVLDILFPSLCLNCQKTLINAERYADERGYTRFLCADCYALIKLNNTLFCPVCRARLAENKLYCGHFITEQTNVNNPRLSASNIRINPRKSASKYTYLLGAAGNYNDPALQNLIHYFKYKSFQNLAPVLGEILIKYLEDIVRNSKLEIRNFIIVPVPLHPSRERKRGFNQAQLLAEFTASHFQLQLINGLKRTVNNKPQVGLKDNETRTKNVLNCFQIKNPAAVSGKNIILVDDVFTSGATMNEAVRILKAAGAKKIIALTLAKA